MKSEEQNEKFFENPEGVQYLFLKKENTENKKKFETRL